MCKSFVKFSHRKLEFTSDLFIFSQSSTSLEWQDWKLSISDGALFSSFLRLCKSLVKLCNNKLELQTDMCKNEYFFYEQSHNSWMAKEKIFKSKGNVIQSILRLSKIWNLTNRRPCGRMTVYRNTSHLLTSLSNVNERRVIRVILFDNNFI